MHISIVLLSYFLFEGIINESAIIHIQVHAETCAFISLCKYLGVEWLNYMVDVFNFLRNYQVHFQSGCNILHSHHQCTGVPVALNLVVDGVLNSRYSNSSVVLSPWDFDLRSSNDDEVEHLFMCL